MGMAMKGLTHCKECWKPLKDNEHYICNNCRKEEKEKTMSKKIFKGYELMEKAMKGEININQKVNSLSEDYKDCTLKFVLNDTAIHVMGLNFELIEDQTIDIDSIKEIDRDKYYCEELEEILLETQNQIIRALKHLNKEIKSLKEKI